MHVPRRRLGDAVRLSQDRGINQLVAVVWGEPAEFTIATVPARFAAVGDPYAGIDAVFSLDPLLEWPAKEA